MLKTLIWALLLLALTPSWAQAHQQQEAYTSILFNQRTGMLEVQHRFYLHDAEHAAQRLIDKHSDLIQDPVSREAFAYYAISSFALRDDVEQTVPLTYVGAEVDARYIWVYQEAPITANMRSLWVKMSSLQEIWPGQINHINIEQDKRVRSVRLSASKAREWQLIQLKAPSL